MEFPAREEAVPLAEIRRYILVDTDDTELDPEFDSFTEAQEQAQASGCAVAARIYEYSDTELVWTPDGGDTWPPE
jgi:hypothetical protein